MTLPNVRRLAALDMWGSAGTSRRRQLIRAEFVIGATGTPLDSFEPRDVTMTMRRACLDGTSTGVSTGTGRDCLGDPLAALAWLAATAIEFGAPLRAGDIVLSGALGPMVAVSPGDVFEAEIAPLGTISARFSRAAEFSRKDQPA